MQVTVPPQHGRQLRETPVSRSCDAASIKPSSAIAAATPPAPRLDVQLVHGVGAALFSLLDSLPEPIIPTSLHSQCVQVADREAAFVVRL